MTKAEARQDAKGLWLKRAKADSILQSEVHAKVVVTIVDAVANMKGEAAADVLRMRGLEALHVVLEVTEIGSLRDHVLDALRNDLLQMAVDVGRSQLGWDQNFYVDDYLILRVNFPYEVARRASMDGENPGIGRLSPWMRETAAARRVKDPLFDPKGYHRGHPPAAWAHGPHLDSWAGHSRDGLNLWWAICDVPVEASMVLYPSMPREALECDRRTLYLRSGIPLPIPTFVPLEAGDLLIFDPEILHGTHLNVTNQTRVAISLRLNAGKPTFDPECFYAREFWRTAEDLENRRFERVLHLKREDNLAYVPPMTPRAADRGVRTIVADYAADGSSLQMASSAVSLGQPVVARLPDRRIIVARSDAGIAAFSADCPHYGVDLGDGSADAHGIYCPACAVYFDLASGCSSSSCLSLAPVPVQETDGLIVVDRAADATTVSGERFTTVPRLENQHSNSLTKSHS